jgi:cyclophilin family peptidyl-prolyl cis-trans isomerase
MMVTTAVSVLSVGLALVTVFSIQRRQQSAEQKDPERQERSTTTAFEPEGGVPCPLPEGQEKRTSFPASGVPDCLVVGHTYKARVSTDAGAFLIALDPTKAPRSVNVFVVLARYHFYDDDLTFHKAVPGFFVQTGDPKAAGVTGPGFTFDDQLPKKGEYGPGAVAMANQRIGANGSQFLVIVGGAQGLPPNYPLFGQVVEGLDVIKKIANDGGDKGEPKVVHRLLRIAIIESA